MSTDLWTIIRNRVVENFEFINSLERGEGQKCSVICEFLPNSFTQYSRDFLSLHCLCNFALILMKLDDDIMCGCPYEGLKILASAYIVNLEATKFRRLLKKKN